MRVDDQIEFFGSKKAFAEALGVSESIIYRWDNIVPVGRRAAVREAIRDKAQQLEQKAKRLRKAAKESGK